MWLPDRHTDTHRQTPDKVIPMCRSASQGTQKSHFKYWIMFILYLHDGVTEDFLDGVFLNLTQSRKQVNINKYSIHVWLQIMNVYTCLSNVNFLIAKYEDLIKQYEVSLSLMLNDNWKLDHKHWHAPPIRLYTNSWPFYQPFNWKIYYWEVSIEHLRHILWHAKRGYLLLRTPGLVPFGTLLYLWRPTFSLYNEFLDFALRT